MIGRHTCLRCKNFIEEAPPRSGEFGKCNAFPDGIPYEVFALIKPFEKPENCYNGIGFEPIEDNEKGAENEKN